jgi:uncharacterized Tic20 family protein
MSEAVIHPDPSARPTSDERLMAALAHGSVLFSLFGPIGPVLVWISQRRKSAYASFHALQAMGYQMLFFWVGIAVALLVVLLWACLLIPIMASLGADSRRFELAPLAFEGFFFLFMFLFWGLYFAGGAVGAILCLRGREFHYPYLGKRLATYLAYDPGRTEQLDEAHEDRWIAAMSHASAILLMWGLITPLAVWITQKDRSPHLRFQALQALVYQLLAVAAYVVFMALYLFSIFAVVLALPLANSAGREQAGPAPVIVLIIVIVILLVWMLLLLAFPTYHLFAMIAVIRILKGGDYRYPLLGNFIMRRLNPVPPAD